MPKPIVAIVGRPNVGKSMLFNRIAGGRIAIVEDYPGVTRDRLYHDAEWCGTTFTLVDTGGLDLAEDGQIIGQVRKQAEMAIAEADAVLFVVDARSGITATDMEVAEMLRQSDKPVILVANKVEHFDGSQDFYEFYQLGLGEPVPVSAAEGMNTGDLLDQLISLLPASEEEEFEPDKIRIAVIGRPNVGKSSLVNAILGEERVIVSDIPGTTRDAIDVHIEKNGQRFVLVDTAGIRRKSKVDLGTERYSVIRSLRAVDRCEVALILLDAVQGVTDQDKRIAGYAHEQGKACIIIVNKWDLVEKDNHTMKKYTGRIRDELGFMQYAPLLFISALTRQRVPRVLELVKYVSEQHNLRISTSSLNSLFREITLHNPPPAYKTRRLKILYATQGGVRPPKIVLFVNDTDLMHFSYLRHLENQLRQAYGFEGTPIQFVLRKRDKD